MNKLNYPNIPQNFHNQLRAEMPLSRAPLLSPRCDLNLHRVLKKVKSENFSARGFMLLCSLSSFRLRPSPPFSPKETKHSCLLPRPSHGFEKQNQLRAIVRPDETWRHELMKKFTPTVQISLEERFCPLENCPGKRVRKKTAKKRPGRWVIAPN